MHTDFFHPDTNLYSCVCNTSDEKQNKTAFTLCQRFVSVAALDVGKQMLFMLWENTNSCSEVVLLQQDCSTN